MEHSDITKHKIQVERTARYFTLNSIMPKTKCIWLVFHGYGQLGEYFIRHFRHLNTEEHAIIAFEGLSRFYVDGLSGRVGASWMTSEDREDEITDQSNYVNAVLNDLNIDPANESRLSVLGFSQGTATAIRWMVHNGIRARQLVIWAGQTPHDIAPEVLSATLKDTRVDFCIGTEDEFIKKEQVEERMVGLQKVLPQLAVHWFEGKHVLHGETLSKVCGR